MQQKDNFKHAHQLFSKNWQLCEIKVKHWLHCKATVLIFCLLSKQFLKICSSLLVERTVLTEAKLIALNDLDLKNNFLPFPQRRKSGAKSHLNDFELQKLIHSPRKFKKLLAQANTWYPSGCANVNWRRICANWNVLN